MARVRRDSGGRILEAHRIWVVDVAAAEGRRAVVLTEFIERLGEPTQCGVGQPPGIYFWQRKEGIVKLRTRSLTLRSEDRITLMAEVRPAYEPLSRC